MPDIGAAAIGSGPALAWPEIASTKGRIVARVNENKRRSSFMGQFLALLRLGAIASTAGADKCAVAPELRFYLRALADPEILDSGTWQLGAKD